MRGSKGISTLEPFKPTFYFKEKLKFICRISFDYWTKSRVFLFFTVKIFTNVNQIYAYYKTNKF